MRPLDQGIIKSYKKTMRRECRVKIVFKRLDSTIANMQNSELREKLLHAKDDVMEPNATFEAFLEMVF